MPEVYADKVVSIKVIGVGGAGNNVVNRMIASGIRALVKIMLITLHRCVLPSPESAPTVVVSIHKKASLNPTMIR